MKTRQPVSFPLLNVLFFLGLVQAGFAATTNTLVDFKFNDGKTPLQLGLATYQATAVVFSASVTNESSPLFSTTNPATNGYLLFTANSTSANLGTGLPNWGGWWAGANLATIQTQYTNGGLGVPLLGTGLPDPSKISLTARVRARGMTNPAGAVVILKIIGFSDNPNIPTSGYRRVQFRPFFLTNSEWTTVGGSFDQLTNSFGTDFNFLTGAAALKTDPSFTVIAEISGFAGDGWGFQNNIRVEIDDVKLTVLDQAAPDMVVSSVTPLAGVPGTRVTLTGSLFGTNPTVRFAGNTNANNLLSVTNGSLITASVPSNAVTGKITVTSGSIQAASAKNFWVTAATNLLADPTFSIPTGDGTANPYWVFFEGARIPNPTDEAWAAGEDASPVVALPGWEGTAYGGFYQEASYNAADGDFFTLSIRGKMDANFSASACNLAMRIVEPFTDNNYDGQPDSASAFTDLNGNGIWDNIFVAKDVLPDMKQNPDRWATYTATMRVTNSAVLNLLQNNRGLIRVTVQPLGRAVNATNPLTTLLFDNAVLKQQASTNVGAQISVSLAGSAVTNGATLTVPDALVGFTSSYSLQVVNNGAEDLVLSNVSATGGFTIAPGSLPITIPYGSSRSLSLKASPSVAGAFSGTVTIANNDKETADRTFTFTVGSSARPTTENFTSGNPATLGYSSQFAGPTTLLGTSTLSVTNGALRLAVDTSDNNVVQTGTSWYTGIQREFATPGLIDLTNTTFQVSLRAFGVYTGTAGLKNKVEVRLESLNAPGGAATGFLQLGRPLDDTGYLAGGAPSFIPDGTYDRVALELNEGGSFVTAGGTNLTALSTNTGSNSLLRAVNGWVAGASTTGTLTPTSTLKTDAPFFRIVVLINQSEFDYDNNNLVEIDSLTFSPGTTSAPTPTLTMANPGFELDTTLGGGSPPVSWLQSPTDGVTKELAPTGAAIYNQSIQANDATATITSHGGLNTMKLRGAYYYDNLGVFVPTRGFVYQEFKDLVASGESVQLKARFYTASIDPLTGGAKAYLTLKFFDGSYNYLGAQSTEVNSANQVTNAWTEYSVTGAMPAGATIVQAGVEYAQNAGTDNGSVYVDTFSIAKVTNTPLSAYDQWLADNGLTGKTFDAVGARYAFGASRPQVGGVASTPSLSGTTLSYSFDQRTDSTLAVTAQYSTDLVNWADLPAGFLANTTGAAAGFQRKLLSVSVGSGGVPTPKSFIRLKVIRTP